MLFDPSQNLEEVERALPAAEKAQKRLAKGSKAAVAAPTAYEAYKHTLGDDGKN